jgi:hypothetical protein
MNLETTLAVNHIFRMQKRGLTGYFVCVGSAMNMLVANGFSTAYSQTIAEKAWDLL